MSIKTDKNNKETNVSLLYAGQPAFNYSADTSVSSPFVPSLVGEVTNCPVTGEEKSIFIPSSDPAKKPVDIKAKGAELKDSVIKALTEPFVAPDLNEAKKSIVKGNTKEALLDIDAFAKKIGFFKTMITREWAPEVESIGKYTAEQKKDIETLLLTLEYDNFQMEKKIDAELDAKKEANPQIAALLDQNKTALMSEAAAAKAEGYDEYYDIYFEGDMEKQLGDYYASEKPNIEKDVKKAIEVVSPELSEAIDSLSLATTVAELNEAMQLVEGLLKDNEIIEKISLSVGAYSLMRTQDNIKKQLAENEFCGINLTPQTARLAEKYLFKYPDITGASATELKNINYQLGKAIGDVKIAMAKEGMFSDVAMFAIEVTLLLASSGVSSMVEKAVTQLLKNVASKLIVETAGFTANVVAFGGTHQLLSGGLNSINKWKMPEITKNVYEDFSEGMLGDFATFGVLKFIGKGFVAFYGRSEQAIVGVAANEEAIAKACKKSVLEKTAMPSFFEPTAEYLGALSAFYKTYPSVATAFGVEFGSIAASVGVVHFSEIASGDANIFTLLKSFVTFSILHFNGLGKKTGEAKENGWSVAYEKVKEAKKATLIFLQKKGFFETEFLKTMQDTLPALAIFLGAGVVASKVLMPLAVDINDLTPVSGSSDEIAVNEVKITIKKFRDKLTNEKKKSPDMDAKDSFKTLLKDLKEYERLFEKGYETPESTNESLDMLITDFEIIKQSISAGDKRTGAQQVNNDVNKANDLNAKQPDKVLWDAELKKGAGEKDLGQVNVSEKAESEVVDIEAIKVPAGLQDKTEMSLRSDKEAWEIVEANIGAIQFAIRKFKLSKSNFNRFYLEEDDYLQMGSIVLFEAAKKWDETKGKYFTYALECMHGVSRHILGKLGIMFFPPNFLVQVTEYLRLSKALDDEKVYTKSKNVRKYIDKYGMNVKMCAEGIHKQVPSKYNIWEGDVEKYKELKLKQYPDIEIFYLLEGPKKFFEQIKWFAAEWVGSVNYLSLDTAVLDESSFPIKGDAEEDMSEVIPVKSYIDPDQVEKVFTQQETIDDTLTNELLQKVLNTLKPKEISIIEKRFGFGGGEGATLEEIGKEMGLTRERIRQIEEKAMAKLEKRLKQALKEGVNKMNELAVPIVVSEELPKQLKSPKQPKTPKQPKSPKPPKTPKPKMISKIVVSPGKKKIAVTVDKSKKDYDDTNIQSKPQSLNVSTGEPKEVFPLPIDVFKKLAFFDSCVRRFGKKFDIGIKHFDKKIRKRFDMITDFELALMIIKNLGNIRITAKAMLKSSVATVKQRIRCAVCTDSPLWDDFVQMMLRNYYDSHNKPGPMSLDMAPDMSSQWKAFLKKNGYTGSSSIFDETIASVLGPFIKDLLPPTEADYDEYYKAVCEKNLKTSKKPPQWEDTAYFLRVHREQAKKNMSEQAWALIWQLREDDIRLDWAEVESRILGAGPDSPLAPFKKVLIELGHFSNLF